MLRDRSPSSSLKSKFFPQSKPPSKKTKVVLILKSHSVFNKVRNSSGTGIKMKVCSKCHLPKEDSEYTWSIRGIKKHSSCNPCRNLERMDYYARNKDKELTYKWDRQLRKREEARAFVDAYKRSHPCADCGVTDPDSLTFDHVRGVKKTTIANTVNLGYTIEAIQTELLKCEIRCWTCHMRIEKKRRSA
jgi:hypothetical protein